MNNGTILLVEDDPDDAALALRALKKNSIVNKVYIAKDGVEALDFFFCRNTFSDRDPQDVPRLILMDVKLPKLDGLEVLRCLREDERTRLLPVVMLSSSSEEKDIAESYKRGANSYIRKAVDYTQFQECIKQLGFYWLGLNEALTN